MDRLRFGATRARSLRSVGIRLLPLGLGTAIIAAPCAAQDASTSFWVSTSGDVGNLATDQPELTDSGLIRVQAGANPMPVCFDGHWRGLGDLLPTDVDALALSPAGGSIPGSALGAVHFSLLSNQGSFLDGDVLRLAAGGGFEVAIAEGQLALELGTPDAALDLDAISFDEQGRLVFSLQNDLSGTVLGDVSDGDVLYRDGFGGIQRRLTEAQVQEAYTAVTGSTSSIGDVLGAHVGPDGLWVSLQSPSSADGGVLLAEGAYAWIPEDQLGLGGAELDGLTAAPAGAAPVAWVQADGSGSMRGRIEGATPGGLVMVLAAGQPGYQAVPGLGAFFVDALDPHLSTVLAGNGPSLVLADGAGAVDTLFDLPSVGAGPGWDGVSGWSFQVIDLESASLSAPFRLDV
jgi:hypothetical protein